jgi:hypothetical protein
LTTWANAICERMIGTLRRELLDRVLIVNQRHLHRVITVYLAHFNAARPHRSLEQLTPSQSETEPPEPIDLAGSRIRRKPIPNRTQIEANARSTKVRKVELGSVTRIPRGSNTCRPPAVRAELEPPDLSLLQATGWTHT